MSTEQKSIDAVRKTLDELLAFLERSIANKEWDQANYKRRIEEVSSQKRCVEDEVVEAKQLIAHLDSVELALISRTQRSHDFKMNHPTPNFKFDIATEVTIRHVETIPPTVKWKKPTPPFEGTQRFCREQRNSLITSASTTVMLYGYRREVYAGKLASMQAELLVLKDRAIECEHLLTGLMAEWDRWKTGASRYSSDRSKVISDQSKLTSTETLLKPTLSIATNNNEDAPPQFDRHPLTLAAEIGLGSTVYKSHVISQPEYASINSSFPMEVYPKQLSAEIAFRGFLLELQAQLREQSQRALQHRKKLSADRILFLIALEALRDPGPVAAVNALRNAQFEERLKEDVDEAQKILDAFDDRVDDALKDKVAACDELLESYQDQKEMQRARENLDKELREVAADQTATEKLLSILQADDWPIGVYASFQGRSAKEGWKFVWEGLRGLAERR